MPRHMEIYCCGCQGDVRARLTNGAEVYPHLHDLAARPYWKCDTCGNFVGCHTVGKMKDRPFGVIPTQELAKLRVQIHFRLDPLWKTRRIRRGKLYDRLSKRLGRQYHTADLRSVEEARTILEAIKEIQNELGVTHGTNK